MTKQQLDLHGMTQRDAVEQFVREANAALERTGGPVTMRVVHGYGSTGEGGVLGTRLRGFCDSHPDRASYVRGEDVERNPGLTIVTVEQALPDARERLGAAIVEYCGRPRTMDRIARRFRRGLVADETATIPVGPTVQSERCCVVDIASRHLTTEGAQARMAEVVARPADHRAHKIRRFDPCQRSNDLVRRVSNR